MLKTTLFLGALLLPIFASAASVHIGGDYFLKSAEETPDDLYAFGRTATFAGAVAGDAVGMSRSVHSQSSISGDALFLGEEVKIGGSVGDDARALGGTVVIEGVVADDVVAVGSEVRIAKDARIGGSLYVVGGDVRIDGAVAGEARILANRMTLAGAVEGNVELWGSAAFEFPARIGGDFIYHSKRGAKPPQNVTIAGDVVMIDSARSAEAGFPAGSILGGLFSLRVLMLLALGFALFFFARERSEDVLFDLMPHVGFRLLRGALIIVLLAAALILLLPTVVGISVALVLGALLLISLVLGSAYAGFLVGAWSERLFFKSSVFPLTYRPVLLGIIFFSVLSAIPYAGPLLHIVLTLSAVGSLGTVFYRHLREMR